VARFAPYCRAVADMLALKDWAVEVPQEPPDGEDDLACISRPMGRKYARVHLSDEFLADTEPEQRHTIVHEAIHLHITPVDFFVQEKLSESDFKAYCMLREYAVDGIADGIADRYPLPSEILGTPPESPESPA
jgi:hypothetical protein